jgi:hypothetical protein
MKTKEEFKIYQKEWYVINRERLLLKQKNYNQKNKDLIRIYKTKWQIAWQNNPNNLIKKKARTNPYRSRTDFCELCKSKLKLEFHHLNYEKNIGVTLCKSCHLIKHGGGNKFGF